MSPLARSWILSGLFLALVTACAPQSARLPSAPVAAGPGIAIKTEAVPLDPKDLAEKALGNFAYAGGLELASDQTSRLHGLSDLEVGRSGRLIAVSDEGDLLTARLLLDAAGHPSAVVEARLAPLKGLDGKPLDGKEWSDSEGLALMPGGDVLISFERHDRIWRYPAGGGAPKVAPMPQASFPENDGMEALAADPILGTDAYLAGSEDTGETWSCRLSSGCVTGPKVALPKDFALVAARRLSGGRTVWLMRAFDPLRGARIELQVTDAAGGVIDRFRLERPLTVDNFEGVAAVERGDGRIRFYIISDDNFSRLQRTLLLAFDWTPPRGH